MTPVSDDSLDSSGKRARLGSYLHPARCVPVSTNGITVEARCRHSDSTGHVAHNGSDS